MSQVILSAVPGSLQLNVLLVDNYDSYSWNLFQLLWKVAGVEPVVVRNDETDVASILAGGFTHIVISPGPGSPHKAADLGICGELLARAEVPCLGVCLGHQALAVNAGALVNRAPEIVHGQTSRIIHSRTGIFAGIPQEFRAVRYHSLAVTEPLPADLEVTARSDTGVIMGLSHRTRPLFGVQFHPESVETEFGEQLIKNFLSIEVADTPTLRRSDAQSADATIRWRELRVDVSAECLFTQAFADMPYSFWLDSARSAYGMGRFSFLGACGSSNFEVLRAWSYNSHIEVEKESGTEHRVGSVFDYLQDRLAEASIGAASCPVPFVGGYVGYLGYGLKGDVGIGSPGAGKSPDAELLRVDRFVAFDHETGSRYLVTFGMSAAESSEWCNEITELARTAARSSAKPPHRPSARSVTLVPDVDRNSYLRHFDQVQEWLTNGDSYEACYTYRLVGTSQEEPLEVYRRLRSASPAPYAAYLRFGARSILSSSPERFIRITADRLVETKPIKGTAARAEDPIDDERTVRELAQDPKARSENLMIVDLLRNDLGQVCEVGSVHVPKLMDVESYATVHQMVTTIRGQLRTDRTPMDCVSALFPGGSMTGAPKKRTVEMLDLLEVGDRGVYSGSLGYFAFDGQVDQSIVIRTIVWEGDRLRIGVGGAITVLSDGVMEHEETLLKARALAGALGAEIQAAEIREEETR